jgi:hypothetical protein
MLHSWKFKYSSLYNINTLKNKIRLIIIKKNKKEKIHDCNCDHPELRNAFKNGKCSEGQIIKCHGLEMLDKLKKEGI